MLFATKQTRRAVILAGVVAVLALAVSAVSAGAQDPTCPYPTCSPYPGTTPGSGTKPTTLASGRASVGATRKCTKTGFPVTISGRSLRRVTIYINGRLAKRVSVKSTATRVTTRLPTPVATSKLVIRVTFATASGTKPKTFTRTVKRCVPAAVKPNFTG